jgi:hypothetical protein
MARVIGIGGVFFRSDEPERLYAWYEKHLGLHRTPGGVLFAWRQADEESKEKTTVWSLFPKDTDYFGPASFGSRQTDRRKGYEATWRRRRREERSGRPGCTTPCRGSRRRSRELVVAAGGRVPGYD